jgi:hypothetical protein
MKNLKNNLSAILESEKYRWNDFKKNISLSDLFYWEKEFDSLDEFEEYVEDRINEVEIIYFSKAIDFLKENDPSLQYSLEIASDYWFTVDKLNSETLATLLLQNFIRKDFNEILEELKK